MEIRTVNFSRAAYRLEDFPRDGRPQFAIAGRSNVGKSSFINTIFRRKGLARVSQTPGKTRGIHFYLVNEKLYVVDLPGYGFAKVSRTEQAAWGVLVQSYLEGSEELRRVFLLLDSRHDLSPLDLQMREWMDARDVAWKIILTKADKLSKSRLQRSRNAIAVALGTDAGDLTPFSAVTREGVERVWREIENEISRAPETSQDQMDR